MRETRVGIWLPAVRAAIFDAIKAAGDIGISSQEIIAVVGRPRAVNTVRVHVFLINDALEETNWRIGSDGAGANRRWFLVKRRRLRVAA